MTFNTTLVLVGLFLLAPFLTQAVAVDEYLLLESVSDEKPVSPPQSLFCQNLVATKERVLGRITKTETRIADRHQGRNEKIDTTQKKRSDILGDRWATYNDRARAFSEKLKAITQTTQQQNSIIELKETIDAIHNTFASDIGGAVSLYDATIISEVSSRMGNVDGLINTHKTFVEDAFITAQLACKNVGADGRTIATDLRDSLKDSQELFKSTRKSFGILTVLEKARATRDAVIIASTNTYKKSLANAWGDVKDEFSTAEETLSE